MAIHSFTLMFLLGIAAPHSPAQEFARKEGELSTIAAQVRTIQVHDAFDGTVPPRIRRLLSNFRNALRDGIIAGLNSNPSESPATMKDRIAANLDRQIRQKVPDSSSGPYGELVAIELQPLPGRPALAIATITTSIPCGTDTTVYVMARREGRWRGVATLASGPLRSIKDAWNDFKYGVSATDSDGRFFVVASVNAWCTSNWQSLSYAVYRVDWTFGARRIFSNRRGIYVAADPTYTWTVQGAGFELTFRGPAADPADFTQEYRYRYAVAGNVVTPTRSDPRGRMGAESAALPVPQTPSIAGRVADSLGHGIPGVSVIALHEAGGVAARATTGSGGMYSVNALPEGGYRVDFDLAGFDITRRNHIRVQAGETASVDAVLTISPVCECISQRPSSSRLQERDGYVVDESDRPLAHAWLSIETPVRSGVTYADGEGRFRVRLPVDGTWPLTAFDTGFGTVTRQVSGGTPEPLVFKLKPAGAPAVPDTERLSRGCCSGDLFTHPSPRTQSPD